MSTLVINIPDPLITAFRDEARSNGVTDDTLAERALRYFLFESRFSKVHEALKVEAKSKGIETDDDVFRLLQ